MSRVSYLILPLVVLVMALGLMISSPDLAGVRTAHAEEGGHAEATAEGHGEAGDHGGVSSEKLWDFIYRVMNFGVLALILYFVLRKPAGGFFKGRRETIEQTLNDFEKKKAETEARFKELESKLSNLEGEREAIMADYLKEGEEEKAKIIQGAHEMAARIKAQAEATINQEIKSAKADLMREIAELSASMAEDLIKKNITEQDQQRLVEEYLEKVVPN